MPKYFDIGFQEFVEENVKELTSTKIWMKNKNFILCKTIEELKAFIDKAIKYEHCVLDVETTGLNTRLDKKGDPTDKLVGIGLAYDNIDGLYVPVGHKEGSHLNLFLFDVLDEIKRLCSNCKIIVHHAKFDLSILRNYKIIVDQYDRFEDTLILARLYDAGQKEIGLKHLSETLLNQPMIELKDIAGKEKRIDFISPEIAYVYVASDAVCTMDLYNFFLQQETVKSQKAIYNLEKRVVPVVMAMESNLIFIDKAYLETEKIRITNRIEELKQEIYRIAGRQLNVGSTQQLGKLLFDELKYRYPENSRTESGQYKTDTAVLEKIADQYPMVNLIIEFRNLEKSLGTYIENLLNNCDEDSCIKLSFNQNGTDTGRFSSPGGKGLTQDGYSAVNVQSIPANYLVGVPDIRKAFKARPGKKIVAMDFSGEELRVAANLSGETKWIDEFLYGEADLHTATGKSVYKKDKISPAERAVAKTLNFQILYGAGPRGISEQAHISEIEAHRAVAGFFEGLPKLAKWIDYERKVARKLKYVKTPFGRIRPLNKFYDSGDRGEEAHADRCAVNFRIQGSSADIMKTVMVRVYNWIHINNLQDEIKILITMHDELVFEIPEDKLATYIPPLNDIMSLKDILQGILNWPVPLTIDAEYGDTWHVDHDFFKENPELKAVPAPIEFHTSTQIVESQTVTPTVPETSTEPVQPESVTETPDPVPPEPSQTASEVVQAPSEVISVEVPQPAQNESEMVPKPIQELSIDQPVTSSQEDENYLIYTVKNTTVSTLRLLNTIIPFVTEESKKDSYRGPKKILRLLDRQGNMFLVSEFSVNVDSFVALARFFNI